jgi:hypothetical protein
MATTTNSNTQTTCMVLLQAHLQQATAQKVERLHSCAAACMRLTRVDVPKQAALLALVVLAWQATVYAMVQRTTLPAGTAALASNMPELLAALTEWHLAAIPCVAFGAAVVAHRFAIRGPAGCCCT